MFLSVKGSQKNLTHPTETLLDGRTLLSNKTTIHLTISLVLLLANLCKKVSSPFALCPLVNGRRGRECPVAAVRRLTPCAPLKGWALFVHRENCVGKRFSDWSPVSRAPWRIDSLHTTSIERSSTAHATVPNTSAHSPFSPSPASVYPHPFAPLPEMFSLLRWQKKQRKSSGKRDWFLCRLRSRLPKSGVFQLRSRDLQTTWVGLHFYWMLVGSAAKQRVAGSKPARACGWKSK